MNDPQKRLIVDLNQAIRQTDFLEKFVEMDNRGVRNFIQAKELGWNEALAAVRTMLVNNCEEEK